ncbi:MAG TPA: hypothetical protein VGO77_00005 [Mycobacterium sp.]|nr:hypothetical protein [Mycobacterium sp.]
MKPPRPCSLSSTPPLVGLLSSNTMTLNCAGGSGLRGTSTVAASWPGAIGTPPMVCPYALTAIEPSEL